MKRVICFLCMIILLSMSITALAGSVPEDLLHSDDAQIFFAEVVYYHPDKENPDIEFSPVMTVKGDVKIGSKQIAHHFNTVGDFDIKVGNVYLFTYFDEHNPTDIFQVENNDISGIKLINVTGDMWERFEEYLNEGRYFEAEQERRQRLGLPLLIDNPIAMGNLPFLETSHAEHVILGALIGAMSGAVVGGIIGYLIKKKQV